MNALALTLFLWQVASQSQKPCVVLKRMGPADQVTSHLYSFGMRGKQFTYVEGQLPEGVKFHGRLTDHDVRKIQEAGGRVAVVDAHYTEQELEQARKNCSGSSPDPSASGEPSKTESKSKEKETKSVSQPPTSAVATTPETQPGTPPPQAEPSTVVVKSTPEGADVTVDGKYMGSTPSTVRLAPGDHTVSIEKSGFKAWQRTMTTSTGGIVTIDAALEKTQ